MQNQPVPAVDTGLPITINYEADLPTSVVALSALWHESEAILKRGGYPDHLRGLIVQSQETLMRRVVDLPCSTEEDLAAKLKFAAFIVQNDWAGAEVERDIIEGIAADYGRLCAESKLPLQAEDPVQQAA